MSNGKEPLKLKNEFRDEIRDPYAGIPKDELVRRDQYVLLKELSYRKEAIEADQALFKTAIERGKAARRELLATPKSPYREAFLQDLDIQIKGLIEKAGKMRFPMSMKLTLLALEELFEKADTGAIAEPTTPTSVEIKEDDEAVAIGSSASGVNSEDEDELTIDEEDNPEEVI